MIDARKRLSVSGLLLGAVLSISNVRGQSRATLEGTVLDIGRGPVADANVTLFSDERVLTTKADVVGKFKFAPLPSGAHYIEVSAPGFFSDSISVKDDTREVSFALEPATSGGVLLACFPSIPPTSVSYEERRGNAQLIGTVTEPLGSPVPHTSITLLRSDLDAPFDHGKNQSRHLGMKQRYFKESVAAQIDSDEKGEFQFAALESGWYTLTAAHEGHETGSARFWVARETLTRVTRVNLFPRPLPDWPNCGRVPAPENAK
jgi:protocatechuate 3,4-dioxygenase beta subunit